MSAEPPRERLLSERRARIARITIAETYNTDGIARGPLELSVIAGEYDDGRIGELFVEAGKEGSKVSGLVSATCSSISVGLQYGIPLRVYYDKLARTRFPPDGFVTGPHMRSLCTSILDAVFQWLEACYDLDTGVRKYDVDAGPAIARVYQLFDDKGQTLPKPVPCGLEIRVRGAA